MEVYYYKCEACGFVYQVPAYWMSYAPEDTHEQMHMNPATGALCPCTALDYAGEGEEG